MQRQNGFTLLELLTTLAVATILVSVAIPGMQHVSANSRQADSINAFVSTMHLARNTAVSQNSRVTLCASSDGQSCNGGNWHDGFIVFADSDSDQAVDPGEQVLNFTGLREAVTIHSSVPALALTYRSNGRLTLPANGRTVGQFTFCDHRGSQHARTLIIELSGRPQVADPGRVASTC
jgi:type IV fimbrial biogenesis protein FimT